MKVIIVGLGVQGRKRRAVAEADVVATVDPVAEGATYRALDQVPLHSFDAALVCTPDSDKIGLLRFLVAHGKHVLVEKPLVAAEEELLELQAAARQAGVACYTAYNHRFEPHIRRVKAIVEDGTLGPIYLVRAFYGNGTARDVRQSSWRDHGAGVIADLGSHLLDTMLFLFGKLEAPFELWGAHRFENRAFDHVLFGSRGLPVVELEGTLVSWRNTFTLEIFGEMGSAHVACLCKWGPSTLTVRRRTLPSGRPSEHTQTLTCADPTWKLEYDYFTRLCRTGGTNLDNDRWIATALHGLSRVVLQEAVG